MDLTFLNSSQSIRKETKVREKKWKRWQTYGQKNIQLNAHEAFGFGLFWGFFSFQCHRPDPQGFMQNYKSIETPSHPAVSKITPVVFKEATPRSSTELEACAAVWIRCCWSQNWAENSSASAPERRTAAWGKILHKFRFINSKYITTTINFNKMYV